MIEFTYTFDQRLRSGAGGYRNNQNGRIVPILGVRNALAAAIDNSKEGTRDLSNLLRERKITLADYHLQMRTMVKNVHLAAAIATKGGYDNMTPSDWGRAGQLIKIQYQKLDNFIAQIESGKQSLDGRFMVRAGMYNEAGIGAAAIFQQKQSENAGFTEELSVLDPGAKHCDGSGSCIEQANKGWSPIGTLVPIGRRRCLTRCRCSMKYRNSQTGETIE